MTGGIWKERSIMTEFGDERATAAETRADMLQQQADEESSRGKKSVFYNHEIIGAAITKRIMRRLKFSNHDIKMVTHLIRNHMFHYTNLWTDGAGRRFMRKVGLENLNALFELRRADRIGNGLKQGNSRAVQNLKRRIETIIEKENAITVRDLAIDGNDIMEHFKLNPGPIIGAILNYLLEEILDDPEKNNRATLLKLGKKFLHKGGSPAALEGSVSSHTKMK